MKKTTHRRTPKKIKYTINKSYKKIFSTIAILFMCILLGLVIGSFYGTEIDEVADDIKAIVTIDVEHLDKDKNPKSITFEEKTRALEIGYVDNTDTNIYIKKQEQKKDTNKIFHFEEPNLEEIDKKEAIDQQIAPEIKKIEEVKVKEPKIIKSIKPKTTSNKPKLVIIIDDVTTKKQVDHILNIGYIVNMSFLPPTKGHKSSAKITKDLDKYMIHLPLQASSSRYEEDNTLHIGDSLAKIEKRIKNLREIYPNTDFLNNHTGSKFTSNEPAMDKLLQILKKYDYTFIDSRTTAKSVAKKSSKKYGVKMFSRNIFLDNKKDKNYIQKQLKKAIKIAKKNGMAIAIGHPYSITFKTLKESKHLLKDLDLVYINQL
jgi:polysaccharide deacetylase 2 family uncharacterized protein YibQ